MRSNKNINHKELVRSTLKSDAYLMVNKKLIKLLGIESAIFLSDLLSKEEYFDNKNQLKKDWFFNTQENRKIDTGIPYHHQTKILKILVNKKLIEVKREGLPARQYFRINYENIAILLGTREEKNSPSQ